MSNGIPELKVENLVVHYRTEDGLVRAVNDVSFEVQRGATMGLVGETGAGKTTTALAMMRLIPSPPGEMVSGRILFAGKDIMEYSEKEMDKVRGDTVSMVFQDPMTSLNPVLTVGEQIAEVIMLHQHLSREEARRKTCEMLELVGIPGARAEEYPHQFSGGMKQRVVIAIALACSPSILIADEPTTALDVTIQAQVLEMMKSLKEKYQTSMLLITHDLGVVAEICDDVSVIYAGTVVEHGSLEDVFNHPRHPYTEGLFNSLPDMENPDAKLKPIKGLMPDPSNLPAGCAFCPRCEYAMPVCETEKPSKSYRCGEHYVLCHLYRDGGAAEGRLDGNRGGYRGEPYSWRREQEDRLHRCDGRSCQGRGRGGTDRKRVRHDSWEDPRLCLESDIERLIRGCSARDPSCAGPHRCGTGNGESQQYLCPESYISNSKCAQNRGRQCADGGPARCGTGHERRK